MRFVAGPLGGVVRVAVSGALVAWLVARMGPGDLLGALGTARPAWLVLAVLTLAPSIALRAKTLELLANKDEPTVTFEQAASLTLVGMSASAVLPPGVSDAVRAHVGYRTLGRPERVVSASLAERIVSLFALAVLGTGAALLAGQPGFAAGSAVLAASALLVIRWHRVVPWALIVRALSPGAERDPEAMAAARDLSWRTLATTTAVAGAGWMSSAMTTFCVCEALHAGAGLPAVVLATLLTALSRLVPITAGGIGVGELTLSYLLVRSGVPAETAASVALATLFVGLLLPAALGMFAVPSREPGRRRAGSRATPSVPAAAEPAVALAEMGD